MALARRSATASVSHHSVWYPINLLAAGVYRARPLEATTEELARLPRGRARHGHRSFTADVAARRHALRHAAADRSAPADPRRRAWARRCCGRRSCTRPSASSTRCWRSASTGAGSSSRRSGSGSPPGWWCRAACAFRTRQSEPFAERIGLEERSAAMNRAAARRRASSLGRRGCDAAGQARGRQPRGAARQGRGLRRRSTARNCAGCHGEAGAAARRSALANPVLPRDRRRRDAASRSSPTACRARPCPRSPRAAGGMLTDRQVDVIARGIARALGAPAALAGATPPPYARPARRRARAARRLREPLRPLPRRVDGRDEATPSSTARTWRWSARSRCGRS